MMTRIIFLSGSMHPEDTKMRKFIRDNADVVITGSIAIGFFIMMYLFGGFDDWSNTSQHIGSYATQSGFTDVRK